jgi:ATP-dependent helicase/nuclease subunit A
MNNVLSSAAPAYVKTMGFQRAAAEPDRSVFVSANAGSGKTKVLTDRVARLLLTGVSPQDILCVTFTKAAAAEMQARLFDRLGKWSVMKDAALVKELGALEDKPEAAYSAKRLRGARALFAAALETPGGLRIETLHGFCQRLISRFPLEAGLAPGFSLIEGVDEEALWAEAVSDLLSEARNDPDLMGIMRRVARAAGGLGVEGAFSVARKARKTVTRWLNDHDDDLEAGLATLQAALGAGSEDVDTLYAAAVGPDFPRQRIAACLLALEGGGKKKDLKAVETLTFVIGGSYPIESGEKYIGLFRKSTGEFRDENLYSVGAAKQHPDIETLFEAKNGLGEESERIRRLHDAILARIAFDRTSGLLRLTHRVFERYSNLKNDRGLVDFDDLIARAKALLSEASAAQWVLYKLDGRLSHVLVDEAQDNNADQWTILDTLTAEFFSGKGAHEEAHPERPRTLFVVGDPKQSIFGFQGAAPEIFRNRLMKADAGAAKAISLPMSFRSTPEVLGFVDKVLSLAPPFSVGTHPESMVPPPAIDPHIAHRSGQTGMIELWPPEWPGKEDPRDSWVVPVDRQSFASAEVRLADRIVTHIQNAIRNGERIHERVGGTWVARAIEPRDILILVRSRGPIFQAINRRLKQAGLPIAGTDRFVLAKLLCVQDALNAMRVGLCPADDLVLAEWLKGPFIGWLDDDAALTRLAANRKGTLVSALRADPSPEAEIACAELDRLIGLVQSGPMQVLSRLLDGPCPQAVSGWQAMAKRFGGLAKEPLQVLLDRAASFDARHGADIQGFVKSINSDENDVKREVASQSDAVRVMTVHGAKGLEAPWVILPETTKISSKSEALTSLPGTNTPFWKAGELDGLEQQLAVKKHVKDEQALESARLLYVALTRAQDRLTICGTGSSKLKRGVTEESWYDLCARAMQSLHVDQLAVKQDQEEAGFEANPEKVTEGSFHWYRYGGDPVSSAFLERREARRADIPSWAREPFQEGAPDHTVSRSSEIAPSALWRRFMARPETAMDEQPVLPPLDPARQARLERGSLIHLLLERLPSIAPAQRASVAERYLAGVLSLDESMRAEIAKTVLVLFQDPVIAPFLDPSGRAEVPITGTGPGLPEGVAINGKIDRLLITATHVHALDFKSDRPGARRAEDIDPGYITQMAAYRAVLKTLYPAREVLCALIWTEGPRFMDIPAEMMDRCLTSLRESRQGA